MKSSPKLIPSFKTSLGLHRLLGKIAVLKINQVLKYKTAFKILQNLQTELKSKGGGAFKCMEYIL